MTTTTKKGSAFPVSIQNERHPLFSEANAFVYDFCLTIQTKLLFTLLYQVEKVNDNNLRLVTTYPSPKSQFCASEKC